MMPDITPLELYSLAVVYLTGKILKNACHFTVLIPQIFLSTYYVLGTLLIAEDTTVDKKQSLVSCSFTL